MSCAHCVRKTPTYTCAWLATAEIGLATGIAGADRYSPFCAQVATMTGQMKTLDGSASRSV
jgi:hypothetical protein